MNVNICKKNKCIKCCQDTEMILTRDDIKRIRNHGYKPKDFVVQKGKYKELKNIKNRCVFHDGNQCMIYPIKPIGCILYPIIYDIKTQSAVIDKDCPYHKNFSITQNKKKMLMKTIECIKKECNDKMI